MQSIHERLVIACTKCEMAFPLNWATVTKHTLLEVFQPDRGRVPRFGMPALFNMIAVERFNKFLRGLLHAFKNIEETIARRYMFFLLITTQRLSRPPVYFVIPPEVSTAVARAGGYGRDISKPVHLVGGPGPHYKLTGRLKTHALSEEEYKSLTEFFELLHLHGDTTGY